MKKNLLILFSVCIALLVLVFFLKTNELDLSQETSTDVSELQLDQFLFFIATKENIQVFGSPKEKREITPFLSNSAPLVGVPFLQLSPHELLIATTRALFLASQNGIREVFFPDEGVIENISFDKDENLVLVNTRQDNRNILTTYLSLDRNENKEIALNVVRTIPSSIGSGDPVSEKLEEFCDNLMCQLSGTLVAPDRKTKLIAETKSIPLLRMYTLSLSTDDGEDALLKEATLFGDHLETLQWLSDSRHVLLTVSRNEANLFYVFDTHDHRGSFIGAGEQINWIEL